MIRLKLTGITVVSIVGVAGTLLVVLNKEVGSKLKSRQAQAIRLKKDTFVNSMVLLTEQYEKLCQQSARVADLVSVMRDERDVKARQQKLLDNVIPTVRDDLRKRFAGKVDPYAIWVVDATGRVAALDKDRDEYEKVLSYPLVKTALSGISGRDVWLEKIQNLLLLRTVAAPILTEKGAVGALIFGFALGNEAAQNDEKVVAAEVAFFANKFVRGTSLSQAEATEIESFLNGRFDRLNIPNASIEPEMAVIGGRRFLTMAALFPTVVAPSNNPPATQFGYVLLSSVDEEVEGPLASFRTRAMIATLGFLVIAVVLVLMAIRSFIRPIERIEQGVLEIISGNREVKFNPDGMGECATLAYQLNQLVAALTGRPAEESDSEASWTDPLFIEDLAPDEQDALIGGGELGQQFAQSNEAKLTDDYYRQVYNDYRAARQSTGEKLEGVTFERFRAKLQKNEESLRKKYKCQAVKFQVQVKEGKTTLKPVPIR